MKLVVMESLISPIWHVHIKMHRCIYYFLRHKNLCDDEQSDATVTVDEIILP